MTDARNPEGERYRLELEALADDVPAAVRLRRALKCLLRGFRLRCRVVAEVTPRRPPPGDDAPPPYPPARTDPP
jgi:hypothetical protein